MKTILINFRAFFGEFKKNIMPKYLLFLILTTISLSVFWTSCTSKSPPSTSKSPSPTSTSSCPSFFLNGKAPEITNPKLTPKTRELCYEEFAVLHSGISKTPLYSAEHLTREQIMMARKLIRKDAFHPEERLPPDERAELSDYARSGYDRGHMAPSADMGTEKAQYESFSLANIVPQDPDNNRGIWSEIEGATRHLANKEGEVYVITGPIFKGEKVKTIGKNHVFVPTQIYKIVYSPKQQKGAVYLCDNAPGDNYKVISIAELEKIAGINFFPQLSEKQKEEKLELPIPRKR